MGIGEKIMSESKQNRMVVADSPAGHSLSEPSPAQLRRFAIDSMAAMDQLRRFGAIDALVEELSGRQTWLWPFFPKPFSEPEQLQLADRSQVQDRCAMVGQ